ncbi:MAG: ATP-binding protein, partial [Candidatus Marsarchaeota archaeon]|nr:ATP-binding protein [Candidatus Marsarchaeota archaeon]
MTKYATMTAKDVPLTLRTKDLPPHAPTLMEATRAIGYSLEAAVADIIDNSVAARATRVALQFFPIGASYMAIMDNGSGMDEGQLVDAMRYGTKNPTDERELTDLGRFGLGLKTASMSQCRRLTVISLKNKTLAGAQWDLDYVIATGEWSLRVLDEEDIQTYPHVEELLAGKSGTLVVWQELDRLKAGEPNFEDVMGQKMDRVSEHLALVFHRYLAGEAGIKKLGISINGRKIDPSDPFLSGKSTQAMDDEVIDVEASKVTVRPYILPHISKLTAKEISLLGGKDGLRKEQGFYVYRNKRLLVWGTWFRMMRQGDLSKLARVRVDIPNSLDHLWTLDIKKSTAVPPEIVRKNLVKIVERIAEGSELTWRFRGKKEIDDSRVHVWNRLKTGTGGVVYAVNREYPLVFAVNGKMKGAEKQAFEHLLAQIERNLPLNQLYVD